MEKILNLENAKDEYLRNKNISLTFVSKKYGINPHKLSYYIKFTGGEVRNSKLKEKCPEMLKEYISSGKQNIVKLCEKYNVARETFKKYAEANGCKITRRKKFHYDESFFENIDSEEKAYWLGFIAADGNVCKKGFSVNIDLSTKDENHLKKFANIFGVEIKKSNVKNNSTGKTSFKSKVSLWSVKVCKSLISKGIVPNKSLILNEEVFKHVPANLTNHFIRGYFDGDGCIYIRKTKKHNTAMASFVGSFSFINKLKQIISDEIGLAERDLSKNKKIYLFQFGGNFQVIALKKWLYKNATVFLERKKEKFNEIKIGKKNKVSKYTGVSWDRDIKKWRVSIQLNKKYKNLGSYISEKDAAKAYNEEILKNDLPRVRMNVLE